MSRSKNGRHRPNAVRASSVVVRSMGFARTVGAGFKALRQGEVSQYTALLEDSRRRALFPTVSKGRHYS